MKDKLGIEAVSVTIMKRSDSVYTAFGKNKRVPYLYIKAKVPDYERIICENRPQGLVNEEYFQKISAVWFDYVSAKYEDYKEYYDPQMYIGTHCFDDECYERFAREQKDLVERFLIRTLGKAPEKLYASGLPGFNIVYGTIDFWRLKLGNDEVQSKIRDGIIELAKENVEKKYGPLTCNLDVRFYHPKMKGYNGYWLFRED
ncbi:MAG: hypothetical protein J5777_05075 [Clostridiales bacterium]|nr:hypothetical protein [Clostridiales bacterium]